MRRLLGLVAALAAAFLALTAAQALANHVQCGDVITQDTTLDSDLLGCSDPAVTITGAEVALDLNGHRVEGNIVAPEQEQLQGHLLIRGGTVHGYIAFNQSKREVSVEDVAANGVGSSGAASADIAGSRLGGISLAGVSPATIHGNVVRDGSGISLYHSSGTITGNLIEGNDAEGVAFAFWPDTPDRQHDSP